MPSNDLTELTRRMMEATAPFRNMMEQMAEISRSWAVAAQPPDDGGAARGDALQAAAERMLQLSEAWIEPVRTLSDEHAALAQEMVAWAERHRQFAEQMAEWAEAHHAVAEQLRAWGEPVMDYAELMSETVRSVAQRISPPAADRDA